MKPAASDWVHVVIVPSSRPSDIIGVSAVAGVMPEIMRFPGETVAQLMRRAAFAAAPGAGLVLTHFRHRGEA